MGSCNCLKVFAALIGPLAWILQVSALGTSNWLKIGAGTWGQKWSVGFFTICYSWFCTILPSKYWSGLVGASAGILGFALALSGIACIVTWVSCCCCGRRKSVATAAGVMYILSALLNIASIILYAIDMPPKFPGSSLGSSFIVAIVGAVCCIIAAIMIIIGGKKQALEPEPTGTIVVMQPQQQVMYAQQPQGQQGYVQQQPGQQVYIQ